MKADGRNDTLMSFLLNHHGILHIRVSLRAKLKLKLTNLIFLDQSSPERVFPVKNGKIERHH